MASYSQRSEEAKLHRKWYSTAPWKTIRHQRLDLDKGLCQMCLRAGKHVAGSVVDHKIPHRGDPELFFCLENTQVLCKKHHDSDKQSEEVRGFRVAVDENGFPLDPKHPAYRKDI